MPTAAQPAPATPFPDARVLVVDDEDANVRLLTRLLVALGWPDVVGLRDPRQVLPRVLETRFDLVLLDLHMPHLDGFAVLEGLRARLADDPVPVMVLTADATRDALHRALAAGASDFLTKPFDAVEVRLRVANLLRTRELHRALAGHNAALEDRVRDRTADLEHARAEIFSRLALAAEYRDDLTHRHTLRVGRTAGAVARVLGWEDDRVRDLELAAPLHDVGKLGIGDAILRKPGPLTDDEFAVVRTHTRIGEAILSGGLFPALRLAERVARTHHERWDGTGYEGLRGEEIPEASRIVAVTDVFDALVHERPYKPAWPVERAVAELERQRGRAFEPAALDAFLTLVPDAVEIDPVVPAATVPTLPTAVGSGAGSGAGRPQPTEAA